MVVWICNWIWLLQVVATSNYSAIANSHTLEFTMVRTKSVEYAVFTGCCLVTAHTVGDSSDCFKWSRGHITTAGQSALTTSSVVACYNVIRLPWKRAYRCIAWELPLFPLHYSGFQLSFHIIVAEIRKWQPSFRLSEVYVVLVKLLVGYLTTGNAVVYDIQWKVTIYKLDAMFDLTLRIKWYKSKEYK
jgi:hypothetical protein